MFTDAITIQILSPADEEYVRAAFSRLSPDSRRLRYGMPVVYPGRLLEWVSLLGQDQHVALGAWVTETDELVGVARYVRQGRDGELAVTVTDDWQGSGVGALLLDALLREACERGILALSANVMLENTRAMRLARRFDARSVRPMSGGRLEFEIPTLGCRSAAA